MECDPFTIWISAVAYSDCDGIKGQSKIEQLRCGGQTNQRIVNAPHISELTGYIKDMAWSYEKEVRIKIQFDNKMGFKRIAIPMPDYVIESMTITPSPLFEGSVETKIGMEVRKQINMDKSKFSGKLSIKTACDSCSIKNTMINV